jgi:hypothetical protein
MRCDHLHHQVKVAGALARRPQIVPSDLRDNSPFSLNFAMIELFPEPIPSLCW